VGTLDPEEAAQVLMQVLLNHLREGVPPSEMVIVVESSYKEELFRRLMATAERT